MKKAKKGKNYHLSSREDIKSELIIMDLSKGFGYSKITDDSELSEQIDLFDPVPIEKAILGGRTQVFRPLSENSEGPFQFNLESQGPSQYLKLNSIRLGGKCKIVNSDGSPLDNDSDVSICNLYPHSLFKSVEPEFNNIIVTDLTSPLDHYQSYIQTLLSYSPEAQYSQLQGQLFIPDDAGKFESNSRKPAKVSDFTDDEKAMYMSSRFRHRSDYTTLNVEKGQEDSDPFSSFVNGLKSVTDSTTFEEYKKNVEKVVELKKLNLGYIARQSIVCNSKLFDFYIPPTCDILQSDRLLHPSISLRLKFTRASDAFSIISKDEHQYRIVIEDLKLYARYVNINPNVINTHTEQLEKKVPLIYPLTRTQMKSYNIPKGETSTYISRMFSGVLPKSIVIGFVSSTAFHGSQKSNPWNFKHYDLAQCSIKFNGENVPLEPYSPNFKEDLFLREYCEFYRNIGIDVDENCGNAVTPAMYKGGCFFLGFDLSGDQCNMLHRHETQTGNIDFSALFRTPLPESVTVVVYASAEADIEISEKGPVMKYK